MPVRLSNGNRFFASFPGVPRGVCKLSLNGSFAGMEDDVVSCTVFTCFGADWEVDVNDGIIIAVSAVSSKNSSSSLKSRTTASSDISFSAPSVSTGASFFSSSEACFTEEEVATSGTSSVIRWENFL
jgi:hypothetical protein